MLQLKEKLIRKGIINVFMKTKILLAIILLSSLIIFGCGTNNPESASVNVEVSAPSSDNDNAIENDNGEQNVAEFDVVAKRWEFTPSTITVTQGDLVRLSIESIDVNHGFSIPEFGVSQSLSPDKTEIVEFTADKTGSFSFFCNVFCGSGHSEMKGTLIV